MSRRTVIGFAVVTAVVVIAVTGSFIGSSSAVGALEGKDASEKLPSANTVRRLEAKIAELEARVAKLESGRGTVFIDQNFGAVPVPRRPSPLPGAEPREINGMTYYILPLGIQPGSGQSDNAPDFQVPVNPR